MASPSALFPITSDTIYESTIRVAPDAAGKSSVIAPAWASQESAGGGNAKPTDAHHHMLHEASVLSSHITALKEAINSYSAAADKWFGRLEDFIASTGYPAAFHNRLTPGGVRTVQAAVAAAEQLAVAKSAAASDTTGTTGLPAGSLLAESSSSSSSPSSAFAPAATQPTSLADATAASAAGGRGGVVLCPSVPGTPVLGAAAGNLTEVATADVLLPKQHEALFRHKVQRRLVTAGRSQLKAAISDGLVPSLEVWLEVYKQAKSLLPDLEHCWQDVSKARHALETTKASIVEAEAAAPLHSKPSLEAARQAMPAVLVQGSPGGQLVAEPNVEKRQQLYRQEAEVTDAELNFELLEKVLRVRLQWLMVAGAGIKGLVAAGMAHALRAAAAEGDVGQAAGGTAAAAAAAAAAAGSGGASAAAAAAGGAGGGIAPAVSDVGSSGLGLLRAPREELLEPFPKHILAHLKGHHLPQLQQLVSADQSRLARWGQRYRDAMAAAAAAQAAAAGATMLAAAAGAAPVTPAAAGTTTGGSEPATAAAGTAAAAAVPPATPGLAVETGLHSTDEPPAPTAGTAAGGLEGMPGDAAASGPTSGAAATAVAAPIFSGTGGTGLQQELAAAAAESGLPVDLLAAAVAADVEESEAAASAVADKWEIAKRLLHDASVVGGKESSVLLPLVAKHVGQQQADELRGQLEHLEALLADMGSSTSAGGGGGGKSTSAASSDAHFDLKVLEVLDALEEHHQFLEQQVLPALSAPSAGSSSLTEADLRQLARQYRQAAAAAPTRPHGWFLGTDSISSAVTAAASGAGSGDQGATVTTGPSAWLAAAGGAAGRVLTAPARAGVRLIDAAADVVRFGGHAPSKI